MPIARLLGGHASHHQWIAGFIEEILTEPAVTRSHVEFGLAMASGWLSTPPKDLDTVIVIERLLQLCADDIRRMDLLVAIFRPPRAPLRNREPRGVLCADLHVCPKPTSDFFSVG